MAYNSKKVLQVLLHELREIPGRYDDYHDDLQHLLVEVLNREQQHALSRISIVKEIADLVNTVGMSLYNSGATLTGDEEVSQ